jgi:hypothetical protein
LEITAVVAIYGAVIATISLAASIWLGMVELNRQKSKIKIHLGQGVLHNELGPSESFIVIDAVNTGGGVIIITSVGWITSDKKKLAHLKPYLLDLPFELEERRKCTFYLPARIYREIEERKKISKIFFADETGKVWTRKIPRKTLKIWETMDNKGWKIIWDDQLGIWYTVK